MYAILLSYIPMSINKHIYVPKNYTIEQEKRKNVKLHHIYL